MKILVRVLYIAISLIGAYYSTYAQCPTSSFDVSLAACIEENVQFINNSTNYSESKWSFCDNNYLNNISGEELVALSNISAPRDIATTILPEGIYTFIIGENNRLIRLFFGNEITNTPQETNFQNVDGALSIPKGIEYYKENENHYLLVALQGGTLVLLDFGPDLSSNPTSSLISGINTLNSVRGLKLNVLYNGSIILYAVGVGAGSRQIGVINFGNSILNTPVYSEFSLINAGGLTSLSLIQDCDQWFGVTTSSSNNKVFKLFFNNDPTTLDSSQELTGITTPHGIDLQWVNERLYALTSSESGDLFRIDFGSDFSSTGGELLENLGNLGILASPIGFDIFPRNNNYEGLAVGFNNKKLSHLSFSGICPIIVQGQGEDLDLSFTSSGTYDVTLTTLDNSGNIDRLTKSLVISPNTAPNITTASQNICLSNPINFTSSSDQTLTTTNWNFGDVNTSTEANPSHTYANAGEYEVELQVQSENGCNNFTRQTIKVYDPPVSNFTLPSGLICTNQEYIFANNTIDNFDGNLTYEWQVDGFIASTDQELNFTFTTGGDKVVKLISSIPGCSVEQVQILSGVAEGAIPSFITADDCLVSPINFVNASIGGSSYEWDFGDGTTSLEESTSHEFATPGIYDVTLNVTNAAGCITTVTDQVQVHAMPEAAFTQDLACSGAFTNFTDLSSIVNSANITNWEWNIEGGTPYYTQNPEHVFETPGEYEVVLTVQTNAGCTATITQSVTVNESPEANFTIEEKCLGDAFVFNDESVPNAGGTISSYAWNINKSVYTTATVNHVFGVQGSYNAKLIIKSSNNCYDATESTVIVDPLPSPTFTFTNACFGNETIFIENTSTPNDEVIAWEWLIDGIQKSNAAIFNTKFETSGDHELQLNLLTDKGCEVSSAPQTIIIHEKPVAAFESSKEYVEPLEEVIFQNNSSGATSYLWDFGGNGNSTSPNTVFSFSEIGQYQVALTAFNAVGCDSTIHKTVHVVNPVNDIQLKDIFETTPGNYILTLKNNGSIPVKGVSIDIKLGEELVLNEVFDTNIAPGELLNHPLSFTIPNAKGLEYMCFTIGINNSDFIEEHLIDNEKCITVSENITIINVFPNPVKDVLNIPFVGAKGENIYIRIIDLKGDIVFSNNYIITKEGFNNLELNVLNLLQGVYLVQIETSGKLQTHRILVE